MTAAAGGSRRLRVGAAALVLGLAFTIASAGPAAAQAHGPCRPMPNPNGGPMSCPNGGEPMPPATPKSPPLLDRMLGIEPAPGAVDKAPLSHYHVYYNDGSASASALATGLAPVNPAAAAGAAVIGTPPSPVAMVEGWLTDTMFTASKWAAALGLAVLGLVYNSSMRDWINGLVPKSNGVASLINTDIMGPLNLAGFFMLLTLVYAGWHTFRGSSAIGMGEFGLSLLIYVVAIIALSNPVAGFVNAVNGVTDIGGQVMSVSLSNGLGTGDLAGGNRCPSTFAVDARHRTLVRNAKRRGLLPPDIGQITCVLRVELVDVPYDLLNWGEVIKPNGDCWTQRQKILHDGLDAGDGTGVAKTLGTTCAKKFSMNPSADRLMAATLFLIAVLPIAGLLIIFSAMVLIALLTAIFLLIGAWPAFALGLLPGGGRRIFWRWATSLVAALASVIAMSAFLALLVWGCAEALNATDGLWIALRFLLMDIVGIMLLRLRRSFLHKVTTAVRNTGNRMPGAQGTVATGAAGAMAGAGAFGGTGGPVQWGGHPAQPRPGPEGRRGISPWVQPASYQSPRLAAPNELSHQLEQKFWHSRAARPLVRAKHGVKTGYPIRHPLKTFGTPIRALRHPISTAKPAWKALPKPPPKNQDGDGYPNNHHPWIPN